MRLHMQKDYEAGVMATLYALSKIAGIEKVRFNQIASITGIKKGTLQRILPRLEKRCWIEKKEDWMWSDNTIGDRIYHYDVKNKITKEVLDDYMIETSKEADAPWFDHIPRRSSRTGLSMKVKRMLLKSTLKKHTPKKYTFYKLIMFPFMFAFKPKELTTKEFERISKNWNIPKGTKRFWKQVARTTRKMVEKEKIMRLNILKAYRIWQHQPEQIGVGKFELESGCPNCFVNGLFAPMNTMCKSCGYEKNVDYERVFWKQTMKILPNN